MREWLYEIKTGRILQLNEDDTVAPLGVGWAGQGKGKNNPAMVGVHNIGPLPPGRYMIGDPRDHPHLGKFAMPLVPDPANDMLGRSGFYIHGASFKNPETSSQGCIIQMRPVREKIHASGCRNLRVIIG
jgi:hypothetical protein